MSQVKKRVKNFSLIVAPAGTNPEASNVNQTLTITQDGAVVVTGNAGTDTLGFSLSNTGVAANTYGSASSVPVFAVDAKGRITSVTNTAIAISAGAVSGLATVATSGSHLDLSGIGVNSHGAIDSHIADTSIHFTQAAIAISASQITSGTLPIARGGTNSATALNNNRVMISSGGAIVEASAITASRALVSDGSGLPIASATTAAELAFVNGVTSAIQTQLNAKVGSLSAIGATPNANAATITGAVLNLQPADASFGGVVTTAAQTFAGDKTFNGQINSSSVVPRTTKIYNIGSTSLRYNQVNAAKLQIVNEAASGVLTGTRTDGANYAIQVAGNFNCSATVGSSAQAYFSSLNGNSGGTETVTISGLQSVFIGGVANQGSGANDATVLANALGSMIFGVSYMGFGAAAGSQATLSSTNVGSICIGVSQVNNFFTTGTSNMASSGRGSLCQGAALTGVAGAAGSILAAGDGSMARGYVTRGIVESPGAGSLASGYVASSSNSTRIRAEGAGAGIIGAIIGTGNMDATGAGSSISGYISGANSIIASGEGSGAWGTSINAAIQATAINSYQFAEGTNAVARSLQVGVAGTGVLLYSTGQIDIPGVLNHDGTTLGFYSVAPVTRPAAYTQTYATTTRTHSNLTSATLTDSSGGTANTTVAAVDATGANLTTNATINDNFADLTAQINALRVDLTNAKNLLNQVLDDLQANGLLQ
jgi:hypothetical protein